MTKSPVLSRIHLALAGVLAVVTVAGFVMVPLDASLPNHWGPDGQADAFAPAAVALLLPCIMISCATIAIGLGHEVEMHRLVVVALGAMMLVLGNYLPKTQQNWIAGVRLPWTLRDATNWQATHFWAGRLMMLAGLVVIIAAIINPPPMMLFVVLIAALALAALGSIAISYTLARR